MKKFISYCLVITIIMSILNFGTVEALANSISEFKSIYNTTSKVNNEVSYPEIEENGVIEYESSESDEKNILEDKYVNSDEEEISVIENKSGELEEKDSEDEESVGDKKGQRANEIVLSYDSGHRKFNSLADAFNWLNSSPASSSKSAEIRIDSSYDITLADTLAIKKTIPQNTLTISSKWTVSSNYDLIFFENGDPGYNSGKTLKFENFKISLKKDKSISSTGAKLVMGDNIEVIGSGLNIVPSFDKSITSEVNIEIRSGRYNEVDNFPKDNSFEVRNSKIDIYGGTIERLSTNLRANGNATLNIYGGRIERISNTEGPGKKLKVNIYRDASMGTTYDIFDATIYKGAKLTVTGRYGYKNSQETQSKLVVEDGATLEVISGSIINIYNMHLSNNSILRVPGNVTSSSSTPLKVRGSIIASDKKGIVELNTDPVPNFYLMMGSQSVLNDFKTNAIINSGEFYFDDVINDWGEYYLRAKGTEKGTLIYDVESNQFKYINSSGAENDAWWINKKNLSSELTYEDLTKDGTTPVLSTSELQIRGNGNNRTLKIDSNGNELNIKFKGVNAINSEFSLKNVNSINIDGKNIIETQNGKKGLTYTLKANSSDKVTFTDDNSNVIVYGKDNDNDKYTIESSISHDQLSSGNASIINMSFEDNITTNKKLQFKDITNSNKKLEFSTKSGYDMVSILLKGDNSEYALCNGDMQAIEGVHYYQISKGATNQNSGKIGIKFTMNPGKEKSYYKVNNKQRVYTIERQKNNVESYYLSDSLKDAMNHVKYTNDESHEIVFLGNYTTRKDDSTAIKNHKDHTKRLTLSTLIDGWKYKLNVTQDIELAVSGKYPVIFEDITFIFASGDKWFYANGTPITFGNNVSMEGSHYPSVSGGEKVTGNSTIAGIDVTIRSGTYKDITLNNVANANIAGSSTLAINGGVFNGEVTGLRGGTGEKIIFSIQDGTFNGSFSALREGTATEVTFVINRGIFNGDVSVLSGGTANSCTITFNDGEYKKSVEAVTSRADITSKLKITVEGGTFESKFIGNNSENYTKTFDLDIKGGVFKDRVSGLGENSNNTTVNMKILDGEFRGDVYGQYSLSPSKVANSVKLDIYGGTFNNQVCGAFFSRNDTIINISGGDFKNNLYGVRMSSSNNKGTINIKTYISIPTISKFNKLIVDERNTLTITNKIEGDNSYPSELIIKNGSEVKLTGSNQSEVKKLTLDGAGSSLTLAMDRDIAPLVVEDYNNNSQKLILKPLGTKIDNKVLIEFLKIKGDVNNFNFNDPDYYIREMDDTANGNKIRIYEKMNPNSLHFKLDVEQTDLDYSINGQRFNDVWWYIPNKSNKNIDFSEDNMFKYKGMGLFKDMNNIASGNKIFEITKEGSKDISIDLGQGKNFDLKLTDSKLTDSTVDAKNIKDIILEGTNSISKLSGGKDPLTINMSGEVKANNAQSYLSIFTGKSNAPFTRGIVGNRDVAKVIDFKFHNEFTKDEEVRLAAANGTELSFTIPNGTGRLGVLFGKASTNSNYKLYHGKAGTTGTSVYVAGNTDATFVESFNTSANNANQKYDYVRRANPVDKVDVTATNSLNFSIDTQSVGLDGINPGNWQQHFTATDMNVENNSVAYKDVFTDEHGVTHQFGKIDKDLEFGYLGIEPSNGISDMKLVNKSQLNSNITSIPNGVKLSLKFNDGINDIPLDEEASIINPLGNWTLSPGDKKNLKIMPDFNSNNIFFNINYNAPATINSSHNITFRLDLK